MKYITTINPTLHEWENNDPSITRQLTIAYSKLLIDNKLSPYDYKPVLGWCYENDDYVNNRITLVMTAVPIIEVVNGNYKDKLL
jgi:hypothetical protein